MFGRPTYEEVRDEIRYLDRGRMREAIAVSDIVEWTDHDDPWIKWVTIYRRDGVAVQWPDPQSQLEALLYRVVPERESRRRAAEPGATDNPDDAQRLREDH